MVGFDLDVSSETAFGAALEVPLENCEIIELVDPHKLCLLRDESGADLWFGLVEEGGRIEMVTANPAFRGTSRFPVTVGGFVSDPQWEPFEYQLSVTFSDLEIPFMVELADPREKAKLTAGSQTVLDVTAFTYEPQLFADSEVYQRFQVERDSEVIFADDHFIPSGLFGAESSAHVMFGGKILEVELKQGSGDSRFWWALVETQAGATINVVFDDASTTAVPRVGELLAGEFWVTARIAPSGN